MTASNNGSENYIASQDISDTTSQQTTIDAAYTAKSANEAYTAKSAYSLPIQGKISRHKRYQDDSIVVAAIPEHDRDQFRTFKTSSAYRVHYQEIQTSIVKNKGTIQLKRVQPRVSPSRWAEGKGCLDLYCDQEHIRSIRFTKKSNTGHQENQGLPAIYEGAPNRTV
ncbi:hypothetical protein CLU79DRAFT_722064 [Phycomyces nitens]|nr:hypothetical protein CLU79DRAFT_722064 [Phycomyces nitens]